MIQKEVKFVVKPSEDGLRIDKFIHLRLPEYSRSYYQKLIKDKLVTVNNKAIKSSYLIFSGDKVKLKIPYAIQTNLAAENIPLNIVFEDEHVVVINKQADLVVHPGAGVTSGTLVNALLYHVDHLSNVGSRFRPGIVHRLDKNTSGLLVVAKNDHSHFNLTKQLAEKSVHREYLALVWHQLSQREGKIETYLNRSKRDRRMFSVSMNGKKAITHYKVIEIFNFLTLLKVTLETGRTHQIRTHLNYMHHPIFGDPEYNGRFKQLSQLNRESDQCIAKKLLSMISRQALHAYLLSFTHPISGKGLNFIAPLPEDIQSILNELEPSVKL